MKDINTLRKKIFQNDYSDFLDSDLLEIYFRKYLFGKKQFIGTKYFGTLSMIIVLIFQLISRFFGISYILKSIFDIKIKNILKDGNNEIKDNYFINNIPYHKYDTLTLTEIKNKYNLSQNTHHKIINKSNNKTYYNFVEAIEIANLDITKQYFVFLQRHENNFMPTTFINRTCIDNGITHFGSHYGWLFYDNADGNWYFIHQEGYTRKALLLKKVINGFSVGLLENERFFIGNIFVIEVPLTLSGEKAIKKFFSYTEEINANMNFSKYNKSWLAIHNLSKPLLTLQYSIFTDDYKIIKLYKYILNRYLIKFFAFLLKIRDVKGSTFCGAIIISNFLYMLLHSNNKNYIKNCGFSQEQIDDAFNTLAPTFDRNKKYKIDLELRTELLRACECNYVSNLIEWFLETNNTVFNKYCKVLVCNNK